MLPDMLSLALFVRAAEGPACPSGRTNAHRTGCRQPPHPILEARHATQASLSFTRREFRSPQAGLWSCRARMILAEADHLHNDMFEYAQGIRGRIRIHANVSALTQFLAQDLTKFAGVESRRRGWTSRKGQP